MWFRIHIPIYTVVKIWMSKQFYNWNFSENYCLGRFFNEIKLLKLYAGSSFVKFRAYPTWFSTVRIRQKSRFTGQGGRCRKNISFPGIALKYYNLWEIITLIFGHVVNIERQEKSDVTNKLNRCKNPFVDIWFS